MEKTIVEKNETDGTVTTYTTEQTGIRPEYLLAAGVGIVGFILLTRGNRHGKPSLFRQYIMPMVMAAAYKKVMEVVEAVAKTPDAEIPAHA